MEKKNKNQKGREREREITSTWSFKALRYLMASSSTETLSDYKQALNSISRK